MSVEVKGTKAVIAELEKRLGRQMQSKIDQALKKAAGAFVDELKKQFETFKDEGYSIDEITVTGPVVVSGVRTMKVHWKGPHNRYRIIHLNEFGTTRNPNPRGKGAIARAMRNSEKTYKDVLARELKGL
ncbi:hypothetical protein NSQ26_09825 [Bacillus sp. FSL W7-1360]